MIAPELSTDPATGEVAGEIVVEADLDLVRRWLGDARRVLGAQGRAVAVLRTEACDEVTLGVEHPLAPMVAVVRWCPTEEGAALSLVESEEVAAWDGRWSARPVEGGVAVRYSLSLVPTFRAPPGTTRSATRRQVGTALAAVARALADSASTDDLR
jgi:hypothetical protein